MGREAIDVSPPALDSSDADSGEFVIVEHEAGSGVLVILFTGYTYNGGIPPDFHDLLTS